MKMNDNKFYLTQMTINIHRGYAIMVEVNEILNDRQSRIKDFKRPKESRPAITYLNKVYVKRS